MNVSDNGVGWQRLVQVCITLIGSSFERSAFRGQSIVTLDSDRTDVLFPSQLFKQTEMRCTSGVVHNFIKKSVVVDAHLLVAMDFGFAT